MEAEAEGRSREAALNDADPSNPLAMNCISRMDRRPDHGDDERGDDVHRADDESGNAMAGRARVHSATLGWKRDCPTSDSR